MVPFHYYLPRNELSMIQELFWTKCYPVSSHVLYNHELNLLLSWSVHCQLCNPDFQVQVAGHHKQSSKIKTILQWNRLFVSAPLCNIVTQCCVFDWHFALRKLRVQISQGTHSWSPMVCLELSLHCEPLSIVSLELINLGPSNGFEMINFFKEHL